MAEIRPYSFIRPAAEPEPDPIPAPAGVDLSTLAFLVVDSVPDMRTATSAQLSSFGATRIDHASRASDALVQIRQTEYDVILSEYDLGSGFDGLHLFEEARHHGLLKASCVFIIVTSERRATRVIGAAELAPDAIVLKPYTGELLYTRLNKALRRKSRFRPIDEAILAHDFLQAIRLCDQGIQAADEDAAAFLRMKVHLLLRIGDWSAVRDACREILVENNLAWARMALGKALYRLKGYAEAQTVFQGVIAEHELVLDAYDWLARTQSAQGDDLAALEVLKQAAQRSPFVINRQRDLGELAWRGGDLATAQLALEETVRLSRYSFWRDPVDQARLGQVQLAQGDLIAARKTAAELRKVFKDGAAGLLADTLDAEVWLRQGESKKARDVLDLALQSMAGMQEPPAPAIGLVLASACLHQQRSDVADQLIRTVLKNSHDDPAVQERVRDAYRRAGQEDKAQQLIAQVTQDIVSLNNEAVRMAQAGELGAAAEHFIKAVADMPANVLVLINAANALLACVNRDGWHETYMRQAWEYLTRIQEIDPDNGRALQLTEIHRRLAARLGPQNRGGTTHP